VPSGRRSHVFLLHSSSTKYIFFVSFPINLKGEIYFYHNFSSNAFESPSLVVTPPPPRTLPLPASRFLQVPRRATPSPPFLHDALFPLHLGSVWVTGTKSWIKQRRDKVAESSFIFCISSYYPFQFHHSLNYLPSWQYHVNRTRFYGSRKHISI
jgi:hypothetical protein